MIQNQTEKAPCFLLLQGLSMLWNGATKFREQTTQVNPVNEIPKNISHQHMPGRALCQLSLEAFFYNSKYFQLFCRVLWKQNKSSFQRILTVRWTAIRSSKNKAETTRMHCAVETLLPWILLLRNGDNWLCFIGFVASKGNSALSDKPSSRKVRRPETPHKKENETGPKIEKTTYQRY